MKKMKKMKEMKKRIGILFVAVLSVFVMTSLMSSDVEKGINFDHMSLADAKVEAIKTGKLIFIDCYTDWCGPCRRMAKTSFRNEDVGNAFNGKFINLKIEMEKDPDGRDVAMKYRINAYPTLLVINGEGKLIKKVIGMQNVDGLLHLAKTTEN